MTANNKNHHDFFTNLVTRAPHIDGNPDSYTLPSDIPWFSPKLAEKGRKFVEDNFFIFLLINFINTFMGLANKPIAVLSYDVFYPKCCAGPRYLSTLKSILAWLISPNYDMDSSLFKEVERVRKLHKLYACPATLPQVPHPKLNMSGEYEKLAQIIKLELEQVDTSLCPTQIKGWSPPLMFTQFELAFVVYGSVSGLYLFPETVGFDKESDGIKGYIHLWAVVGRMLGLKDEFNPALNPDKDLYLKMMNHLGFGTLKLLDENVVFMWEESIRLLKTMIPFGVSVKAILYNVLSTTGLKPNNLWSSMTFGDKFAYYLGQGMIQSCSKVWILRQVLNSMGRKLLFHYAMKKNHVGSYR